jgi:hypothetical protein
MCDSNPFLDKKTFERNNTSSCTESCEKCDAEKKKKIVDSGKICSDAWAAG